MVGFRGSGKSTLIRRWMDEYVPDMESPKQTCWWPCHVKFAKFNVVVSEVDTIWTVSYVNRSRNARGLDASDSKVCNVDQRNVFRLQRRCIHFYNEKVRVVPAHGRVHGPRVRDLCDVPKRRGTVCLIPLPTNDADCSSAMKRKAWNSFSGSTIPRSQSLWIIVGRFFTN